MQTAFLTTEKYADTDKMNEIGRHTLAEAIDSFTNERKRHYLRLFGLHHGQHSGVNTRGIERLQSLKGSNGAPDTIRTCDPLIRSQVLYPAELRVHWGRFSVAR